MAKPTIIILGAGFGGLRLAKRLASIAQSQKARVVLISRDAHQLYTPSIYEVVGGAHPRQICIPLEESLAQSGVEFIEGTVSQISLRNQTLTIGYQGTIHYDHLVLAVGSVTNDYGIKGVQEHAYPLKTLHDAWFLRQHIESEFSTAKNLKKQAARQKLTFVIAGGGPAGVELAGELATYCRTLAQLYQVPNSFSAIELVEASPEILGKAHPKTIQLVRKQLTALGVRITTNKAIKEDRVRSIVLGDRTEASETLIWTAGVKPNPLISKIRGLEVDRRGAALVDANLRAVGHENVWGIGDAASVVDSGVATAAIRQADLVARNLLASLTDRPLASYEPQATLLLMPIGHNYGVFQIGQLTLAGWWVTWLKHLVDFRYLARILPFVEAVRVWLSRLTPCPDCHTRLRNLLWDSH